MGDRAANERVSYLNIITTLAVVGASVEEAAPRPSLPFAAFRSRPPPGLASPARAPASPAKKEMPILLRASYVVMQRQAARKGDSAVMEQLAKKLINWASILEDETRQQALRTASMPFIWAHLALMPDAHLGALSDA
jgi:hypothetical protein